VIPPLFFACWSCKADGACLDTCPERAATIRIEAEMRAELDADRKRCAADGHIPSWAKPDHWPLGFGMVCERCGEDLDEGIDDVGNACGCTSTDAATCGFDAGPCDCGMRFGHRASCGRCPCSCHAIGAAR
jgi:hypothetical protein